MLSTTVGTAGWISPSQPCVKSPVLQAVRRRRSPNSGGWLAKSINERAEDKMSKVDIGVSRQAKVRDVTRHVADGKWCAGIAPRFSGKTTLAKQLLRHLRDEHPGWKVTEVSFRGCITLEGAWRRVLEAAVPGRKLPDERVSPEPSYS